MDYRDPRSIPLPPDDDGFEKLCLLIARDKYGAEYYRYGRAGQKQFGIDIYSAYYDGKCLQCKLRKKRIPDADIIRELNKDLAQAKQKFPDLKQFIFAVSIEFNQAIENACRDLSDEKLKVIPWFWNQMQDDIAGSKWLLRYYLKCIPGAQWISDGFIGQELLLGNSEGWQPLSFYSSNIHAQWYGILKNWDAPRRSYTDICQAIRQSFINRFHDLPVAAIVRGEGGSGKSVLLRRIAVDLKDHYTVYWIGDNAEDFLENEWKYDVENNPNELYLLVIEDWYGNFTKTDDRITANKLIQKVKSKQNVRLLIGDRPNTPVFYPKSKSIIYDLGFEENTAMFSYILHRIPEWADKFPQEQKQRLLKTGFFQLLFVYQNTDTTKIHSKATNYFLEIIQSDYTTLIQNQNPFFKGLAHAIYIYAYLYSDYSIQLTPETVIYLSETYSKTERPSELAENSEALIDEEIINRYFDLNYKGNKKERIANLRFLHDTLADEGWKGIELDRNYKFNFAKAFVDVLDILKESNRDSELSYVLYFVVKENKALLSRGKILSYVDYLISVKSNSAGYFSLLFSYDFLGLSEEERKDYLNKVIGVANENNLSWVSVLGYIRRTLSKDKQLEYLTQLINAGNKCQYVLEGYYLLLPQEDLKRTAVLDFTIKNLANRSYKNIAAEIFRKLADDEDIQKVVEGFLGLPEPWIVEYTFSACIKIVKNRSLAKQKAREYLQLHAFAKAKANFAVCLQVLEEDAIDIVEEILKSPTDQETHRIVYRALQIAAKIETLDAITEDAVKSIFKQTPRNYDKNKRKEFHFYLQVMRVPLFRSFVWQQEVNILLDKYRILNRNLFYSLTISHINKHEPLAEPCLYFIRNWRNEFARPKKKWGYITRSLAHPHIQEDVGLRNEVYSLCQGMLYDKNCPVELKEWLSAIVTKEKFPDWKRQKDDDGIDPDYS